MENGHEPATKADVKALDEKIITLDEKIEMLRNEVHHGYDDLKDVLRDNETKLLQAFYGFAQSNQERLTQQERDAAALKERLAIFERRLMDLERKVNFPGFPPQQR
ncbi:MAG: hypothetical protein P4L56_08315 [Candidatus Sulfopaludibacter sp.]|nr:hypothetical protein [Candidatus Sulfopaludibacter sp.]